MGFAENFIAGHAAGQQSLQREQDLESAKQERSLRTMILKHQIDAFKIEDALHAQAVARANLQQLQGMPQSELEQVLPGNALPARNLATAMNPVPSGQSSVSGDTVTGGVEGPISGVPLPNAQEPNIGRVQIPGLPAIGDQPAVPGISVRPQTLQEQLAARRQQELEAAMNKVVVTQEGATATIPALGNQPIARGGAKPKDEFQSFMDTYPRSLGKASWDQLSPSEQFAGFTKFHELKETPDTAASRAVAAELARARLGDEQKKNAPVDVTPQVQTTLLAGGMPYLDESRFGKDELTRARKDAEARGIPSVSKETADGLVAADRAAVTLDSMWAQLKPFLPTDAQGRLVSGPQNLLGKVFQSNPTLGAFPAWRTAAVQAVQALAEKGMGLRLNAAEISNIIEGLPKITDDAPTAQQKMLTIKAQLESKVKTALTKDRRSLAVPGGVMAAPSGGDGWMDLGNGIRIRQKAN